MISSRLLRRLSNDSESAVPPLIPKTKPVQPAKPATAAATSTKPALPATAAATPVLLRSKPLPITNIGNTCFLASALHLVSSIDGITEEIATTIHLLKPLLPETADAINCLQIWKTMIETMLYTDKPRSFDAFGLALSNIYSMDLSLQDLLISVFSSMPVQKAPPLMGAKEFAKFVTSNLRPTYDMYKEKKGIQQVTKAKVQSQLNDLIARYLLPAIIDPTLIRDFTVSRFQADGEYRKYGIPFGYNGELGRSDSAFTTILALVDCFYGIRRFLPDSFGVEKITRYVAGGRCTACTFEQRSSTEIIDSLAINAVAFDGTLRESVEEALPFYLQRKDTDDFVRCSACEMRLPSTIRQTTVTRLSRELILMIERNRVIMQHGQPTTITFRGRMKVPLTLQITLASGVTYTYELRAFTLLYGQHGGHYTTVRRMANNVFWECNDTNVSNVTASILSKDKNSVSAPMQFSSQGQPLPNYTPFIETVLYSQRL